MQRIFIFLLITGMTACAAPVKHYTKYQAATVDISDASVFYYDPVSMGQLGFRGELNMAKEDDDLYGMMYPGDAGIAGVIVGIAAHAITENQKQNSRETKQREEANRVLLPVKSVLDSINDEQVFTQAFSAQKHKILPYADASSAEQSALLMTVSPVFYLAQDYSTLRVKNIVSVYSGSEMKEAPVYRNLVDAVQALPIDIDKADSAESLAVLTDLSTDLLTESIQLALADASNALSVDSKLQTFKYLEGGQIAYTRAKLITKDCSRFVIRTLRDWIKSVPMSLNQDVGFERECSDASTLALAN